MALYVVGQQMLIIYLNNVIILVINPLIMFSSSNLICQIEVKNTQHNFQDPEPTSPIFLFLLSKTQRY